MKVTWDEMSAKRSWTAISTAGLRLPPTMRRWKENDFATRVCATSERNSNPFSGAILDTETRITSPFGASCFRKPMSSAEGLKRSVFTPRRRFTNLDGCTPAFSRYFRTPKEG